MMPKTGSTVRARRRYRGCFPPRLSRARTCAVPSNQHPHARSRLCPAAGSYVTTNRFLFCCSTLFTERFRYARDLFYDVFGLGFDLLDEWNQVLSTRALIRQRLRQNNLAVAKRLACVYRFAHHPDNPVQKLSITRTAYLNGSSH